MNAFGSKRYSKTRLRQGRLPPQPEVHSAPAPPPEPEPAAPLDVTGVGGEEQALLFDLSDLQEQAPSRASRSRS